MQNCLDPQHLNIHPWKIGNIWTCSWRRGLSWGRWGSSSTTPGSCPANLFSATGTRWPIKYNNKCCAFFFFFFGKRILNWSRGWRGPGQGGGWEVSCKVIFSGPEIERLFSINVFSHYWTLLEFLPRMLRWFLWMNYLVYYSIWISVADPDPFHFGQPDPDPL